MCAQRNSIILKRDTTKENAMEISNILKRTWDAYVEENISKELTREKDFIGKHQLHVLRRISY
jgi:hypothetical protein